ncbi:hypothetical protein EYV94_05955 [Puteibacter caeruleilacunae]|nr:hypothetical protein EYV94_05955 [Puteibacter caeruleilacunae]
MAVDDELFRLVEKYLTGALSKKEQEQFIQQVSLLSELAEELELQQDIERALAEADIIKLRESLKEISRGTISTQNSSDDIENSSFKLLDEDDDSTLKSESEDKVKKKSKSGMARIHKDLSGKISQERKKNND